MKHFDNSRFNKAFSSFILIGMGVVLGFTTFIKMQGGQTPLDKFYLIVAAVGAIAGILATVSAANGKMVTFIFGIVDVIIYGAMCILGKSWGTAALHLLYLLPMQFIGIWQWKKRQNSDKKELKARRLNGRQLALTTTGFLLLTLGTYIILLQFDQSAANTFIVAAVLSDALVTVCNILGQALMSTAFMEQWIFWIGVNISSIVMWSIKMAESDNSDFAIIYVVKYSFYLLNALNGLRNWIRLSREQ